MLTPEFQKSLYAPSAPLDATRYFLIIPDNLGHGASTKPSDGLKAQFPLYGYRDLVALQHKLVTETLGIERLHAIVGLSMGGMNAWPVVALPSHVSGCNLLWRQMAARYIQQDPGYEQGNYTVQPRGAIQAAGLARLMIEGVPHMQRILPDVPSTQAYLQTVDQQSAAADANNFLYSVLSSQDYAPESQLSKIQTKAYALNFDDDEFNPVRLGLLGPAIKQIPNARYAIQPGSADSYGHLTMTHPGLWAQQVALFMHSLESK